MLGQGMLQTYRYTYADKLYNFLKKYNYDEKFHTSKQLGAIQYFFKGAHHTRYEYIFLQWTLIHELKSKSNFYGLNSKINSDNDKLKMSNLHAPTPAELLQCLTILTNMGHFPLTYSASKVWFNMLKNNYKGVRTAFRDGLNDNSKRLFKTLLKENDFYRIHLMNSLFLLQRYKRKDNESEIVDFSTNLLEEYMDPKLEDLKPVWDIFRIIRKMSYLYMDSNYAPIPFKLDLSSLILTLDSLESPTVDDSIFNKTLNEINSLLENTLYLSPNTILMGKYEGEKIERRFNNLSQERFKVSELKSLLSPHNNNDEISNVFNSSTAVSIESSWDSSNSLDLDYNISTERNIIKKDVYEIEEHFLKKLGSKKCIVGAMIPPDKDNLRIAFSIKNTNKNKENKALDIVKEVLDFDNQLLRNGFEKETQSKISFYSSLFEYLLKYCFHTNFKIEFHFMKEGKTPFFVGKGSQTVAAKMEKYINYMEGYVNSDQKHEYDSTVDKVNKLNYRVLIFAYLGSTIMKGGDKNQPKRHNCEFDGLICLPNNPNNCFLYIIEAKNTQKRENDAKNQLKDNLSRLLSPNLNYEVEKFLKRDAYAKIFFK